MIELLVIILVVFLLMIYLINVLKKDRESDLKELEREEQELLTRLEQLEERLQRQQQLYNSNVYDPKTRLPKVANNVLDIYDKSNIRIPADILEELGQQQFYSERELMNYIENQRNYWKLENTKKVYKG